VREDIDRIPLSLKSARDGAVSSRIWNYDKPEGEKSLNKRRKIE